ncbi:3-oxoadipate enol-lactonase [Novosphingobium sp. AAP83]|uniref:3-oxoadipate enol-lactonase n=1 Tax=Novosphingobium sp. AAP83 TaxID=1523425 RepID=UPI0006B90B18|nr:3-oxoadipate enol-lactonase [Novosphingobium sp. AAP83]KPF89331.1 3-oxoadipate enol-lactonase [Novosphingobium sp. AAP83]
MNTPQGFAIMIDGCRIAWRMDGPADAPVLVLSNSLGTAMAMWEDQVPALAERFRVLRYDTRGHGASSVMPGETSLDRLGRDVIELLDQLGIDTAHFCGLSLGGMTGQWLGVHAAERLDRLVIANSTSYMGPPEAWQQRMTVVREQGMGAITPAVLERWFTSAFAVCETPGLARTREQLLDTAPDGYAACCAAIRDMDLRRVVNLVNRPTLVIAGRQDPATPPDHAEAIVQAIASARLVSLEAAHLSNIEQPEAFTSALLDFLG